MRAEIASLIDDVQRQERRNRMTAAAIVAASLLTSGALFLVALQFYPKWVAVVVVALVFPLLLWAQRPGVTSLRFSRQDAALAIDAALHAKARTVSLLSLEQTGADDTQAARELMELQLSALVTNKTDARSIAPYVLSLTEKRSLQVSGLCIAAMLTLLFFRPLTPLEELAHVIEQIQAENLDLPSEVLHATNSLLEQLQDPEAEPREISSAISSTQEIVASAQGSGAFSRSGSMRESKSSTGNSAPKPQRPREPTKASSQDEQPPANASADSKQQQANEPSKSQQGAQQNQDRNNQQGDSQGQDSQQQQQPSDGSKPEQGSQENKQAQQDQQQGSQGGEQQQQSSAQKQGGGQNQEEQANPQGGGSSGAGGSGQGSSGEGQQDSQEQSDPGSGQSQGTQGSAQEGKEGQGKEEQGQKEQGSSGKSPQGSQSGDSDAAQAGQDSQKSGMQKLEQALKKAEDALKNAEQKEQGGSQGEGDGSKNKQGGKDSSSQGKSKESARKEQPGNQDSPKQDSSKQGESKGQEGTKQDKAQDGKGASSDSSQKDSKQDQNGQKPAVPNKKDPSKQGDPSGAKPGEQDSQEPKKQNERNENKPGSQDSTGANSPDIDRNAKARPGSAEDEGPPGPGLGGKEEFKEVAIDTDNEKLDERYTGDESSLEQSDAPAQPKTSIEDVTLAKPKPSSQKLEQPIPLEYRDVLK
jgi:hypothetical protein